MNSQAFDPFEADLCRAFASLADPVDNGFSDGVARRVATRERAGRLRAWFQILALVVAGGAAILGFLALGQALVPTIQSELGLQFVMVQGALAQGDIAQIGASVVMTQMLAVLAMGVGGVAALRAISE